MLPGRTDNEIKNLWNTHIKKKLLKMNIDPVTHQPINQQASPEASQSTVTAGCRSDNMDQSQSQENEAQVPSSENTSPAEASSNSRITDPLVSGLWDHSTPVLLDELWPLPGSEDDYSALVAAGQTLWDDEGSCEWLLDYPVFGVGDLGLENHSK